MNNERELQRHNKIIEQIRKATKKEELPKVVRSQLTSYLSKNLCYKDIKIPANCLEKIVNDMITYGNPLHEKVKKELSITIHGWFFSHYDITNDEIDEMVERVLNSKRVEYFLIELFEVKVKLDEFANNDIEDNHKKVMKEINSSYEVTDLPKVGLTELNKRILKAISNGVGTQFKASDIKKLTDAYLRKAPYLEIEQIVDEICKGRYIVEYQKLAKQKIMAALRLDKAIDYIVDEINAKEKRKLVIYRLDHEETMENIKNANRISQLPPNLTTSAITSYLNGNTTIYPKDDRITADDLKKVTELLLEGYEFDGMVVTHEILKIAKAKYPDKEDAFKLLYDKLSSLPRTKYLVEEVKYAQKRQKEFISRGGSNVNVYFIPNDKTPDGGRFYNCYINRVDNLDLEKILPLDLSSIVPSEMDIDSIEWYVQEHYDDTFKVAGGIILKKDETIGNVSIFKPNDGKVGVSVEEKEKMDQMDDLDSRINEKQKQLDELEAQVHAKEEKSSNVEKRMQEIVRNYERKALELQQEFLASINELKNEVEYSQEENVMKLSRKKKGE